MFDDLAGHIANLFTLFQPVWSGSIFYFLQGHFSIFANVQVGVGEVDLRAELCNVPFVDAALIDEAELLDLARLLPSEHLLAIPSAFDDAGVAFLLDYGRFKRP